jgi:hypothetical protein
VAKSVLVHTCYEISDGEVCPGLCACYQTVNHTQAKRMISEHIADWVTEGSKTLHNAICIIGGSSRRTPRAATIDAKHIMRAYVSKNLEEQVRIDAYGLITLLERAKLVREVPWQEFDDQKKRSIDIPVLQFIEDSRTPGGVGEEK